MIVGPNSSAGEVTVSESAQDWYEYVWGPLDIISHLHGGRARNDMNGMDGLNGLRLFDAHSCAGYGDRREL